MQSKVEDNEGLAEQSIWNQSIDLLKSLRRKATLISFLLIFLAQIVYTLGLGTDFSSKAALSREFFSTAMVNQKADILDLFSPMLEFFLKTSALFLTCLVLVGAGYFFLLSEAVGFFNAKAPKRLFHQWLNALWLSVRIGIPMLIFVLLAMVVLQILFPPLSVIVFPFIVAPVICLAEHKGVFPALSSAISFRYTNQGERKKDILLCLGQLSALAILIYLGVLARMLLEQFLDHLDQSLGFTRGWYLIEIKSLGLPAAYFVNKSIIALLTAVLIMFSVLSTTVLYFRLQAKTVAVKY